MGQIQSRSGPDINSPDMGQIKIPRSGINKVLSGVNKVYARSNLIWPRYGFISNQVKSAQFFIWPDINSRSVSELCQIWIYIWAKSGPDLEFISGPDLAFG